VRDFGLLSTRNAKTMKSTKHRYATAILHLASYKSSGYNVCPMAEIAQCWKPCLTTAGRGGMCQQTFNPHGIELPDNVVQRARVRKTRLFVEDQPAFLTMLANDIEAFVASAKRARMKPAIRLNGTSDIVWESLPVDGAKSILALFPQVQFYDYTKLVTRRSLPNYHLTASYSGASPVYARSVLTKAPHLNWAVVFGTRRNEPLPKRFEGRRVIDGDASDLRFLDPEGVVVGLRAKGRAIQDTSGFVVRLPDLFERRVA
jgi:hypothetical protein